MQSKATTVQQYLTELPANRRQAIERVRAVVLKSIDPTYEEGMQYGMISYYVPHRVYPAGYHTDPKQPLPFVCLASQKNHMALYLSLGNAEHERWFRVAWAKAGRKLDMGKSCLRFKQIDDLALDVLGESIRRMPAVEFIKYYEAVIKPATRRSSTKPEKPSKTKVVKTGALKRMK